MIEGLLGRLLKCGNTLFVLEASSSKSMIAHTIKIPMADA
jgi:hypothetical protein